MEKFAHYFRIKCSRADIGIQGGVPGTDGRLDNNDFVVYINWFFASDPRADVGIQGGVPGSDQMFDNNDWVVYINWFFSDATYCVGDEESMEHPCGNRLMGGGANSAQRADDDAAGRMEAVRAALQGAINALPPGERREQLQEILDGLAATP